MACAVKFCRRRGLLPSCTNMDAITMHPPTVMTRKYEDQCGCRTCCSYPNNVWVIIPAQILTAVAFTCSAVSYADCELFRIRNTSDIGIDAFTIETLYNGTIPTGLSNDDAPYRSMGLFAWEDIHGSCSYEYYDDAATDGTSDLTSYWVFLGSDFQSIRVMGGIAVALGFFVLVWMICVVSCVAHTRRYRGILEFLLLFLLPLLQSLTFRIFATEFCVKNHCEMHKSGHMAIVGMVFYFLAGLLLCIGTQDFPGNPYKQRKQVIRSTWRTLWNQRAETSSENDTNNNNNSNNNNNNQSNYNTQRHERSPLSDVEMVQYNNGFADAVEIPVESEFIDRTLIDADAVPTTSTATTMATMTHTTVALTEFLHSTSTTAQARSDSHSTATTIITAPHDLKSNV